jgi:GDP-4-dehydro-6-deoxy-D-mannose reductase
LQAFVGTGQDVIRTRSFNHTGPGQVPDFVVPGIARRIAEAERNGNDEITVGRTDTVREVNDVRDIVRAYRLLVLRGEPGAVYNVCSGIGLTIGAIVDHLLALARRPVRTRQDPKLVRAVDVPRLVGDPALLQAATAWKPEIPLDQTLADVLAEARQPRWVR